jgi:hypothetical protein
MVRVRSGGSPSAAVSALPIIFVEGKFDEVILRALFGNSINVKALGHSGSVRSVAEALHTHHPDYFFIADMDHFDKNFVDSIWDKFPDPSSHNLLIWRKREIENYFIEPSFLAQSECFTSREDVLSDKICEYASERVFFDIANLVIIRIREIMKEKWIEKFIKLDGFETKDLAREKLLNRDEFNEQLNKTQSLVSQSSIKQLFDEYVEMFLGGSATPKFMQGRWIDMIQGMELYNRIINNSGLFSHPQNVPNIGEHIAKELIKNPGVHKPSDFYTLRKLVDEKILALRFLSY